VAAVTAGLLLVLVVLIVLGVPALAGLDQREREAWSVVAGVIAAIGTLAAAAAAAVAAGHGSAAARDARLAAENARITLGAHRDTTQLLAVLFPKMTPDDDERWKPPYDPIPVRVTVAAEFELRDIVLRYRPDGGELVEQRVPYFPGKPDDLVRDLGQLPGDTPYGRQGEVDVECTDPAFGTRRLARLEVRSDGRGRLVQQQARATTRERTGLAYRPGRELVTIWCPLLASRCIVPRRGASDGFTRPEAVLTAARASSA
jgi:hypothetical protein